MTNVPQYFIKEFNGSTTIVLAVVTETADQVSASVSLVYSDYYQLQHTPTSQPLAKWSITKVDWETEKTCQLPPDTVLPVKGFGLGSLVRNLVVEKARDKFAGYRLQPAKLSAVDDVVDTPLTPTPGKMSAKEGVKNAPRRHHFYENAGFELEYSEPGSADGFVKCADIGQLKISNSSEEPFLSLDLGYLIQTKEQSIRELTQKLEYQTKTSDRLQTALNKLKKQYRKHVLVAIGIVGFLMFCMYLIYVSVNA
ncbi:hypothetical protein [Shewanella marisflavi]|uniref:hypothetical protein n=1 Tax=Shewanella marisflavi TaxID=260364 RepID=UPI003AABBC58